MHVYPGEAFDRAADGSAVTSHYRSVNQRLSKLGHTGHVLLLVGVLFAHQTYREVLGGQANLVNLHKSEQKCSKLYATKAQFTHTYCTVHTNMHTPVLAMTAVFLLWRGSSLRPQRFSL